MALLTFPILSIIKIFFIHQDLNESFLLIILFLDSAAPDVQDDALLVHSLDFILGPLIDPVLTAIRPLGYVILDII